MHYLNWLGNSIFLHKYIHLLKVLPEMTYKNFTNQVATLLNSNIYIIEFLMGSNEKKKKAKRNIFDTEPRLHIKLNDREQPFIST